MNDCAGGRKGIKVQIRSTTGRQGVRVSYQLLVQFKVKADQTDTFVDIMQGAKARIAKASGCMGVELLLSTEQPGKVVLSEIWETKELHDQYAEKMRASGVMDKIADFLTAQPESEFFEIR